MFQPAPRRHRRLPSGTMVSYAEVKSYLSKREIPQLFESLMAGLMYHRPENHIGYLQTCLDEVKTNSETKVQWSTFVNAKKRKSKEILPPLTPKKQDSYSSSWSDNSRQSTPLPPISARTRTRMSLEQQDFRNTYILYHNPPPVLAKPKVPVVSVLGGLGTKIDELCERVVGRLRGVVHISTCSMLKTRMTIEGFYRVTAVPACAVVDSVLQAMSMVQSANALLVAGFPRNRGDIEEYRSRRVRMDGVVLVDFEEEALRNFLEHEVATGVVRPSEIEAELDRFKQDIISVAEYYDDKQLLTVVMGDQDLEEIIDDLVLAVDKVIETRKNIVDEESMDISKDRECDSPCKALIPSPDRLERPSTVEIRDATEEDIKTIEAEAKKTDTETADTSEKKDSVEITELSAEAENVETKDEIVLEDKASIVNSESGEILVAEIQTNKLEEAETEDKQAENSLIEKSTENEVGVSISENNEEKLKENGKDDKHSKSSEDIPIGTEDNSQIKEVSEIEAEIQDSNNAHNSEQAENTELNQENKEASAPDTDALKNQLEDELAINTPNIPLIFSFENVNADYEELRNLIANDLEMCFIDFHELMRNDGSNDDKFDNDEALTMLRGILKQDSVSYSNGFFISTFPFSLLNAVVVEELQKLGDLNFVCKIRENKVDSESESNEHPEEKLYSFTLSEKVKIIFVTENNIINELREALQEIIENKNSRDQKISHKALQHEIKENSTMENVVEQSNNADDNVIATNVECSVQENGVSSEEKVEKIKENGDGTDKENISNDKKDIEEDVLQANEEIITDEKTNECEDSTGKDVDDLISDDTLNEGSKLPDSLKSEEDQETIPDDAEVDDVLSQASTLASAGEETQKERAVLERQPGVEMEIADSPEEKTHKAKLVRSTTYSASENIVDGEGDKVNSAKEESDSAKEPENDETAENEDKASETSSKNGNEENVEISENKEEIIEAVCVEDIADNAVNEKENNVIESNQEPAESESHETNEHLPDTEEKNGEHLSDSEERQDVDSSNIEEKKEEIPSENEEKSDEHASENGENNSEEQQSLSEVSKVENKGSNKDEDEENVDENEEKTKEAESSKEEIIKNESLDNEEIEAPHADTEETSEPHNDSVEHNNEGNEPENISHAEDDGADSVKDASSNAEHAENDDSKEESVIQDAKESDECEPGAEEVTEKETPEIPSENEINENEENTEKGISEECKNDSSNEPDQDEKETSDKSDQLKNEVSEKSEQLENEASENSDQHENEESEKMDKHGNEASEKSDQHENEESEKSDKHENETSEKLDQQENEDSEKSDKHEIETSEKSDQPENEASKKSDQNENEASEKSDQHENGTSEKLEIETLEAKEGNETNQENDSTEAEISEQKESEKENELVDSKNGEQNLSEAPENKQENSENNNNGPISEDSAKNIRRLDNDSDSNDENITIETQAEIHAIDCESPPAAEDPDSGKAKPDIEEKEDSDIIESNADKGEMENKTGDDSVGKKTEAIEDDLEKETMLENIDESDKLTLDSISNDRYSAKIQERNGSGILDESRAEDQRESEEPQERSSSSSRGEL